MKAPNALTALVLTLSVTASSASIHPDRQEEAPGMTTEVDAGDHSHDASAAVEELSEWQVMAEQQRRDRPGVYGADAEMVAKVRRDMDKFTAAGLVLPPLRIYVHDSKEGCKSHDGLFNGDGSGDRIDLCHHLVLLHELAHAWEAHNVNDATRRAFMERTEVDVWNDHTVVHHLRGIEQAADVIATGVRAEQLRLDDVDLRRVLAPTLRKAALRMLRAY